jgi:hypothetical protein
LLMLLTLRNSCHPPAGHCAFNSTGRYSNNALESPWMSRRLISSSEFACQGAHNPSSEIVRAVPITPPRHNYPRVRGVNRGTPSLILIVIGSRQRHHIRAITRSPHSCPAPNSDDTVTCQRPAPVASWMPSASPSPEPRVSRGTVSTSPAAA